MNNSLSDQNGMMATPPPGTGKQRKTYVEATGTRAPVRIKLKFVEPKMENGKPVIEIPPKMTQLGREKWKHTIIAYVLGPNLIFREMTNYVNYAWQGGKVQVHGGPREREMEFPAKNTDTQSLGSGYGG